MSLQKLYLKFPLLPVSWESCRIFPCRHALRLFCIRWYKAHPVRVNLPEPPALRKRELLYVRSYFQTGTGTPAPRRGKRTLRLRQTPPRPHVPRTVPGCDGAHPPRSHRCLRLSGGDHRCGHHHPHCPAQRHSGISSGVPHGTDTGIPAQSHRPHSGRLPGRHMADHSGTGTGAWGLHPARGRRQRAGRCCAGFGFRSGGERVHPHRRIGGSCQAFRRSGGHRQRPA